MTYLSKIDRFITLALIFCSVLFSIIGLFCVIYLMIY